MLATILSNNNIISPTLSVQLLNKVKESHRLTDETNDQLVKGSTKAFTNKRTRERKSRVAALKFIAHFFLLTSLEYYL
jgi:hypothetical protein